ncbi:hypothetical protein Tco_0153722 [Tanacetum coccineum]
MERSFRQSLSKENKRIEVKMFSIGEKVTEVKEEEQFVDELEDISARSKKCYQGDNYEQIELIPVYMSFGAMIQRNFTREDYIELLYRLGNSESMELIGLKMPYEKVLWWCSQDYVDPPSNL